MKTTLWKKEQAGKTSVNEQNSHWNRKLNGQVKQQIKHTTSLERPGDKKIIWGKYP